MTAPNLPRDDQATEQVYDWALEEHAGDGEKCATDGNVATHTYRHGPCFVYICAAHAERVRNNILTASQLPLFVRLYCDVCGQDPLRLADITVRPL